MQIRITDLMKTPGVPFEFEFDYCPKKLEANGEELEFDESVKVSATCVYTGENYNLTGTIKGKYKTVCDRCNNMVEGSLSLRFDEEYSTKEDLSHPDRYLFDGHQIDLTKMVDDNIILSIPMKHLCSEDCRGLCPYCGCNLNVEQCDCGEHPKDDSADTITPFAGLKKLLDKQEEV